MKNLLLRKTSFFVENKLTSKAVGLTLLYLLLWTMGPIFLGDSLDIMWLGLPLWFWFSCIAAPLVLVFLAWLCFYEG